MKNSESERGPDMPDSDSRPNSPTPINLGGERPPDDTGFLIVRFKPDALRLEHANLENAAAEAGLLHINKMLKAFNLIAAPTIRSVMRNQVRELEARIAKKKFAPEHSLLSYWRLDARRAYKSLEEIEAALRHLPEVDLVYREKTVTDPANPGDDTYAGLENFLDAAKVGVDARWAWTQQNGEGQGMHFIDVEQGWIVDHEDLPNPQLIFNDNNSDGNHGTAVVGIVAGVDNDRGIIGIAPQVKSVRLVSHWNHTTNTSNVAEAITAAITKPPLPHVLLVENQSGGEDLPPETDDSALTAIRSAVASGVIVVETAGNGSRNLDTWTDPLGKHRLNRNSPEFQDSGAIIVGAGTSKFPHQRSIWPNAGGSNFGSRIDCYAWGDSIVSTGFGNLPGGFGQRSYTNTFGGTSGAASIIAGCALLLQGLHFAAKGALLSPAQMRDMLSNPNTGTGQDGGVAGRIGVMPDLRAIVENGDFKPNIIRRLLLFMTRVVRAVGLSRDHRRRIK